MKIATISAYSWYFFSYIGKSLRSDILTSVARASALEHTQLRKTKIDQSSGYLRKWSEAKIRYFPSDATSRAGAIFYMGHTTRLTPRNGLIEARSDIIRTVVLSAKEAEYTASFMAAL